MIHPIFKAVLHRPELLFEHLSNYAALVRVELAATGRSIALKAAGALVAVASLLLALGLTGVAVMIGFSNDVFHWVLVIVPGVAWLLVGLGAFLATRSDFMERVTDVQHEVAADLRLLQIVKEMKNE